jgi:hypothetical protein
VGNSDTKEFSRVKFNFNPMFLLLLSLLLLPLMVTNDSLWLDEGDTAMYALQPDFQSWCRYLRHDLAADCQMPLSMLAAWAGGRTIGTSEWQMRAINILWGALALIGMYKAGKRLQLSWLPLLLAIQPYFWFYMNEARPYASQIACGAWLFAAFAEFWILMQEDASPSPPLRNGGEGQGEEALMFSSSNSLTPTLSPLRQGEGLKSSWAWMFSAAVFFLCLATMLAPIPIAAVVIAAAIAARLNRWKINRKSALILIGGALANVPIAIYYLSTLARGAKGAQLWHVDLKFFAYVLYEFTGMTGLGLAVEKIREIARAPHLRAALMENFVYFVLPGICFLLLSATIVLGLRKRVQDSRWELSTATLMVLIVTSLVFVTLGVLIQKAFWARHFAPVFPFYVALLGFAGARIFQQRSLITKLLPCSLMLLLLFSALSLRFAERHRKENYRAAAEIAKQALDEKKSVWWVAAPLPAQYYHLECALTEPEPGKAFCPQFTGHFENLSAPDLIVYSKPDVHDSNGAIAEFVRQKGYHLRETLKSFTIFARDAP